MPFVTWPIGTSAVGERLSGISRLFAPERGPAPPSPARSCGRVPGGPRIAADERTGIGRNGADPPL
jgi:hypothetical protein